MTPPPSDTDRAAWLDHLHRRSLDRGDQALAEAVLGIRREMGSPAHDGRHVLDRAEALRVAGDTQAAAIAAWTCLRRFPASWPQASALLARVDEVLPGVLFSDHLVWVATRALVAGGSWLTVDGGAAVLPTAWDGPVLGAFARVLREREASSLLDVGASSGSFALLGSVLPGLTCHAVEPNPGVADLLRRHLLLNGLDATTTIHPCALSDETGQAVLSVPEQTGLGTLGDAGHLPDRRALVVDTFRLDDLVDAHGVGRIDAIKIDTEGHELRILEGAEHTIARWRPVLLLEAVDVMMARHGYERDALDRLLHGYGYESTPLGPEDLLAFPARPTDRPWRTSEGDLEAEGVDRPRAEGDVV